jgi:hypothetical protein
LQNAVHRWAELGPDTGLFFVDQPAKIRRTIPEFDTLDLVTRKKRGCIAIGERHLSKVKSDLASLRFYQFFDRLYAVVMHPSTHTQYDGVPLADEPFNPEGHGITSPPTATSGENAQLSMQTACHS